MQIICNNCGNDLTFPNEQHLVTCSHCLTHLEIRELENTISATVVENPDFDDAIFKQNNLLANAKSLAPLYNLLHLELEYNEAMEEHFFRSVLVGKPFFPIMSRGIYRLIAGLLMMFIWLTPNPFNWISILVVAYGALLMFVGIKEIIKFWRFRPFEKYYFKEQATLNKEIQEIDLSNRLNTWHFMYSKNMEEHLAIRAKYFYINISDKLRIKIMTPLLSQGLRLLAIVIILVSLLLGLEEFEHLIVLIFLSLFSLLVVVLFFLVINKSNTYVSKYLTLLKSREGIIEELKDILSE